MKCKGLHQLEFTEEELNAMRDSVYGYNDELAYSILNGENAGQYVLGHISEGSGYNFSFGRSLYRKAFHHEFTHDLLGLSFLKRGRNPLPFEYGYDGGGMAEAMVCCQSVLE